MLQMNILILLHELFELVFGLKKKVFNFYLKVHKIFLETPTHFKFELIEK